MLDLSVIIVNYNSSHFLQLCLDSLAVALENIEAETIVVDNQSQDDSCAIVKENYPWVKLLENDTNEGFGCANNRGIALAQGKHILLLNPDTVVSKETLQQSISILKRDAQVAAVGVKMLDGSGCYLPESKRGLPLPETAFYKAFGLTRMFPNSKRFARYYLGHLSSEEEVEVEVLAGAYMMCDAAILKSCGGFDEDFFMYGEDIDLSYRMTQKGYKIIYSPEFPIIHFKGESARRDDAWAKRFYDAMHLFSQKHFSDQGWLWSKILDAGIHLKKLISSPVLDELPETDFSVLNLAVLGDASLSGKWKKITDKFQSASEQNIDDYDLSQADAVLFLPEVDKKDVINIMHQYAGQKQFLFSTTNFALSSPSSLSQGDIYSL